MVYLFLVVGKPKTLISQSELFIRAHFNTNRNGYYAA